MRISSIENALRWRWVAALALVLGVVAVLPGVRAASKPDNALTVWFLETDPQLERYRRFQATFGNDEVVLLNVHRPDGVLERKSLEQLRELERELLRVPGIARVHSVLSVPDVVLHEGAAVRLESPIPNPLPESDEELDRASRRVLDSPIYANRLVDPTGTRTMVWAELNVLQDIDERRDEIVGQIRSAAARTLGSTEHSIAGFGVIYSALNGLTQRDFGLFVGLSYALIFATFAWAFQGWRWTLAAMGVLTVGALGTLGAYGLAGHRLNMVTATLPVLVGVLGIADAVHFPTAFNHYAGCSRRCGVLWVAAAGLQRVWLPCLFTTLTTMAGFLALASAPMAVLRQLGLYAALGVGLAFVASSVFMPLALIGSGPANPAERRAVGRVLERIERWLRERPVRIALTTVLLTAAAVVGASRVTTDTYTLGYLPDDHVVVQDDRAIRDGWGFYAPLDFVVIPSQGRTLNDEHVIAGIERFVEAARTLPEISGGYGLHTYFRRFGHTAGASPESVESNDLQGSFRSPDGRRGRITLIGDMLSAQQLSDLLARLDLLAHEAMQGAGTLEVSGYPPLYVRIIDYVMRSQVQSFAIAVALIFALMMVWLRSARLAMISMVPNLFPVLAMMGAMGALGIPLDIATASVAAIVLGVSIDDTVHFLHHWRNAERRGLRWDQCLRSTFESAGRAAVMTSILLVAGYSIMMLSELRTVFYFGLLTSIAAVAAPFADLALLPLLLRLAPARLAAGSERAWLGLLPRRQHSQEIA